MIVPLITVELSDDREYISVAFQAPLDEIVKHFKIFEQSQGES